MRDNGSRRLFAFAFKLNVPVKSLQSSHARLIPLGSGYFGARRLTLTPYPVPLIPHADSKSFLARAKPRKKSKIDPIMSWKWTFQSSSNPLKT